MRRPAFQDKLSSLCMNPRPPSTQVLGLGPGPAPRPLSGVLPGHREPRRPCSWQRRVPDGKHSSCDAQGGSERPGGTHSTRWGSRPPAGTACGRRAAGRARGTPAARACSSCRCPSRPCAARCPSCAASGSRRSRCCGNTGRTSAPRVGPPAPCCPSSTARSPQVEGGRGACGRGRGSPAQDRGSLLPAPRAASVSGKVHLSKVLAAAPSLSVRAQLFCGFV